MSENNPHNDNRGSNEHQLPGIINRRKNGFQSPLDPLQISTWILFPLIITHYYAFLYFLLWDELAARVILTIFFSLFAVLAAGSVVWTCTTDPADDVLCGLAAVPQQPNEENHIYCYLCEVYVDSSSKHCRYCDKCVTKFDHHCKWLNTCIGSKNYPSFLSIVLFVFLLTAESLALSIALMVESFALPSSFHNRVIDANRFSFFLGSSINLHALQALLIISVVIMTALVAMLIQLGGFHLMLLYRGLTTYDFIVLEQKRAREAETEKMKRQTEQLQQQAKSDRAILSQANSNAESNLSNQQSLHYSAQSSTSIEMVPQKSEAQQV